MKLSKKITAAIAKVAEVIIMVMIALMVLVIVGELCNRNFFGKSFRPTIEICGIAFLWMAFIGLIPLYEKEGLMRLDFLVSKTRGKLADGLYLVNKLFSLLLGVVMPSLPSIRSSAPVPMPPSVFPCPIRCSMCLWLSPGHLSR